MVAAHTLHLLVLCLFPNFVGSNFSNGKKWKEIKKTKWTATFRINKLNYKMRRIYNFQLWRKKNSIMI